MEELIGTTEYPTIWARYRIKRCRYNRVRLYFILMVSTTTQVNKLKSHYCGSVEERTLGLGLLQT